MFQVGVHPEDVQTVCLTHLHPDQTSGCTRRTHPVGEALSFPNASHVVQATEYHHWTSSASLRADSEYDARVRPVENADNLRPLEPREAVGREAEGGIELTADANGTVTMMLRPGPSMRANLARVC